MMRAKDIMAAGRIKKHEDSKNYSQGFKNLWWNHHA